MTRLKHNHSRQYWWLMPNLLGLDAPIIALLWQDLFARAAGVKLLLSGRLALGLAVWAVYVADRLLDTTGPVQPGESERHRFCRDHRGFMTGLLAAIALAGAAVALFIRPILLADGLGIAIAVGIYFSVVHITRTQGLLPKEVLVAFLFTAGTVLAPWTRTQSHGEMAAAAVVFFAVCALNTIMIEYFEWERLRSSGEPVPHPVTHTVGAHLRAAALVVTAGALTITAVLWPHSVPVLLACGLSALLLLWLHEAQDRLTPVQFRVLTDAALLSPVLMLLSDFRQLVQLAGAVA